MRSQYFQYLDFLASSVVDSMVLSKEQESRMIPLATSSSSFQYTLFKHQNEVYIDVVECFKVIMTTSGRTIYKSCLGKIICKPSINEMSEIKLKLAYDADNVNINSAYMQSKRSDILCASIFKGNIIMCEYVCSNFMAPITIKKIGNIYYLTIKRKTNLIRISIPIPSGTYEVNADTDLGEWKYNDSKNKVVWKIKNGAIGDASIKIKSEHLDKGEEDCPILVEFEGTSSSYCPVKINLVKREKVQLDCYIKHFYQTDKYEVRISN